MRHARTPDGRRAIRYTATSLVGVVLTQILLIIFLHLLGWKPVISNFTAVVLTSVPAFLLNKYWVWGKRGRAHMRREVIPFWLFTVAGWGLSTIAVIIIVNLTKTPTEPNGNKLAVQAASIIGFGVLWILKYLFLDKIMFGGDGDHVHHTPYDEDAEREEAELEAHEHEAHEHELAAHPGADPVVEL